MAEPKKHRAATGPGSRPIAATLVEVLTGRDRLADRTRAIRASGLEDASLASAPRWLAEGVVAEMFAAASVDSATARSIGHQLVTADRVGGVLYGLGLATPEKAYRRAGALLPRESANDAWETAAIEGECARLLYHPGQADHPDAPAHPARTSSEAARCAMRRGMLESIPMLYGLLPAEVREEACVARGDAACRYEVRWTRDPRRGLLLGGAVGVLWTSCLLLADLSIDGGLVSPGALSLGALLGLGFSLAFGRAFDLHRQLEAVAGGRRGQLALFEQVDDQLASKLDALARADAELDRESDSRRSNHSSGPSESASHGSGDALFSFDAAAREIHEAAGDLECWLDAKEPEAPETEEDAGAGGLDAVEARARVREIRDWAARIAGLGARAAEGGAPHRPMELERVVARAIASLRPLLPGEASIETVFEEQLPPVECDPVGIEQVAIQLIRNAVEATQGLTAVPEARVSLRRSGASVELAIEDRGAGIESAEVDEVFDPFFGERPLGIDSGFGLPGCLKIVEQHGGEMRIEAGDRPGTRVTVVLPALEDEPDGDEGGETEGETEGEVDGDTDADDEGGGDDES